MQQLSLTHMVACDVQTLGHPHPHLFIRSCCDAGAYTDVAMQPGQRTLTHICIMYYAAQLLRLQEARPGQAREGNLI